MQINIVTPFQADPGIRRPHALTPDGSSGFLIDEGAQFAAKDAPAYPPAPATIGMNTEVGPEDRNKEIGMTEILASEDLGALVQKDAFSPSRGNFAQIEKSGNILGKTDTEGTIVSHASIDQSVIVEAVLDVSEAAGLAGVPSRTAGAFDALTTEDRTQQPVPGLESVALSQSHIPVHWSDAIMGATGSLGRLDPKFSLRPSDINTASEPFDDGRLSVASPPQRTIDPAALDTPTVSDPHFEGPWADVGIPYSLEQTYPEDSAKTVPKSEGSGDIDQWTKPAIQYAKLTPDNPVFDSSDPLPQAVAGPRLWPDVKQPGTTIPLGIPTPGVSPIETPADDSLLATAAELNFGAGFHRSNSKIPALSPPSKGDTRPFELQYDSRGSEIQQSKCDAAPTSRSTTDAHKPIERNDVSIIPPAGGSSFPIDGIAPAPNRDPFFALLSTHSGASTLPHGQNGTAVALHQLPQSIAEFVRKGADGPVELSLRPDELGRLKFEMTTAGERVHVTLFVERPESMDLIRRYSDQLLQDLRLSGFSQPSLSFGDWSQRGSKPEYITPSPSSPEPTAADGNTTIFLSSAGPDAVTGRLDLRL